MRTKIIIVACILITFGVTARIISPFLSWDSLKEQSTDIIVVYSGEPVPVALRVGINNAPKSDAYIKVISVLKGTNDMSSARLQTDHELRQGESYLVFGYYGSGIYQAFEEYRVIPLGNNFSTNSIAGKPLDEQLQILFQHSIDNLNREIQKDQEEKARLEGGLQK